MSSDGEDTDVRHQCRAARRAVPAPERVRAAREVAVRLSALVGSRHPGQLGTYLPTDGEIDPTLGVDALRADGWRIHLPVIGPNRSMRFAEWPEGGRLSPNRYGIDEPAVTSPSFSARELDLVLIPCVAVDPAGTRLGFGAGYYDRALTDAEDPRMTSSRPRPLLVGVVFDVQVVPELRPEPWDVPLDAIVCESATIMTGARTWPPG